MTGDDIFFVGVIWLFASVPLALLVANFIRFGAESETAVAARARRVPVDEAA